MKKVSIKLYKGCYGWCWCIADVVRSDWQGPYTRKRDAKRGVKRFLNRLIKEGVTYVQ